MEVPSTEEVVGVKSPRPSQYQELVYRGGPVTQYSVVGIFGKDMFRYDRDSETGWK